MNVCNPHYKTSDTRPVLSVIRCYCIITHYQSKCSIETSHWEVWFSCDFPVLHFRENTHHECPHPIAVVPTHDLFALRQHSERRYEAQKALSGSLIVRRRHRKDSKSHSCSSVVVKNIYMQNESSPFATNVSFPLCLLRAAYAYSSLSVRHNGET